MIALCVVERHADLFSRYKWATQSSSVALVGDEKQIYAYEIEQKDLEDAVVPAISDL